MFLVSELEAFIGHPLSGRPSGEPVVVAYARVSSRRQAGEGAALEVYSDVASGLSDNRAGLRRALTRCMAPEVGELVVTHRERLARFGTHTIERLLAGHGVQLGVIGEDEALSSSAESELVRDMLAVVTSFSGRLYGRRSAKARELRHCVTRNISGEAAS